MTSTEQRIADLQKQLDELKASLEKKEDRFLCPKDSEEYWFVGSAGNSSTTSFSADYFNDVDRLKFNNVFQTQEQAQRHAKRLKLYNKLWKLAEHLNGDWVLDNGARDSRYWIVYFDFENNKFAFIDWAVTSYAIPVFKSKELAQRAISMLTDEEKEIFKNIYRP